MFFITTQAHLKKKREAEEKMRTLQEDAKEIMNHVNGPLLTELPESGSNK